ncbi:MAG: hypothetical protein PHE52_02045 [Candidatus Pacebacteria bacterium]|nr:hypothetical protein [Candidatus Paceibacterota bacterium]
MLTYTTISTGATSIFFLFSGLLTYRVWLKNKTYFTEYFSIFLLALSIQQGFFSLASGVLGVNPLANSLLWAVAHIFMFISIAYLIRIPLRMALPKLENIVTKIIWIYAIIGLAVIFLSSFGVEHKLLDNGVYLFKVPFPAVITIIGFTTPTMLFTAIVFLWLFFRSHAQWFYKLRGLIWGLGMVLYLTSGPAHNIITNPKETFLVDSLLIVASLLFLVGIYLPRLFKGTEEEREGVRIIE